MTPQESLRFKQTTLGSIFIGVVVLVVILLWTGQTNKVLDRHPGEFKEFKLEIEQ